MHIYLDLDLTLVNVFPLWTTAWNEPVAAKLGLDPADVFTAGEKIWSRGDLYTLERHLRELGEDPYKRWAVVLRREFEALVRSGQINYDDTSEFLNELASRKHRRSILTFGDKAYQSVKVDGLRRSRGFFERLCFMSRQRQKAHALCLALRAEREEKIVMLDDSASELEAIARHAPSVRLIQIRRTPDIPESPDANAIVSDLMSTLEVLS